MNSFGQYLIDEFVQEYLERRLTRREALRRIAAVTGNFALASGILAACGPQRPPEPTSSPTATATAAPTPAPAGPGVSPTDPDIVAEKVPGQGATLLGYLARPKSGGPFPSVLICHENRGIGEHLHDVARRFAKSSFVGLSSR